MSSQEPQIAAVFDVDGTLYSAQFGRGLLQYTSEFGRKSRVWAYYLSLLPGYLLNKAGLYPDGPFLRLVMARLARLLAGMDQAQLAAVFDWNLNQYLFPTARREVLARLNSHKVQGHHVVLISAQFQGSLNKFVDLFGAHGGIGTGLEVWNGRVTGRVQPPVMTGEAKRRLAEAYFEALEIEPDWENSWAYADSFTDREILARAGNPVAVYPDEKLARLAEEKGWEILAGPETMESVLGED